jgi:mycothiol synthase
MSNESPDLVVRHPAEEDAEAILALMVRGDIAEYGSSDSDLVDLHHDWERIDLNKDAWIIEAGDGHHLAYAAVLPWGRRDTRIDFIVDPSWVSPDLGKALVAQAEARVPGFIQEREIAAESAKIHAYVAHANERDRKTLEESGYRPGKYYFQMQVKTAGDLALPTWPAGVTVRTAVAGEDDRAIYEAVEASFARPGRETTSFEDWAEHTMRADLFDPALWFLAVSGDEIAGVSLAFNYPSGGWVRQLGVVESWRRKGIGAALLQHTFRAFKERGVERVGLSVESERPDAFEFYKRVGMHKARQYDEFLKAAPKTE